MKTGIVVLNYNDARETINFVNEINSFHAVDKICIVDNGSDDGSYQKLKKLENKDINVINLNQNRGYASGNNAGLKYLYEQKCDYMIIANPDIIIDKTSLIDFIAYMKAYPQYRIFGPTIKEGANVNQGWKLKGISYDIIDNLVWINRFFKNRNKYKSNHYNGTISEVDVVSGCFFGLTRGVIDKIGYLDEGTFLYYEENILAKKAKDANLKIGILNNVNIIHNHSVTIDKTINHYRKLRILKNSQYYYRKTLYNHKLFTMWLLKKTGNLACAFARMRTDKKIVNIRKSNRKKVNILSLHMQVGVIEKSICSLANMLIDKYDVEIVNLYKLVDPIPFSLDERIQITYLSTGLAPNKEAFKSAVKSRNIIKILKEGTKAINILYKKRSLIKFVAKDNDGDIIVSSTLAFNKYFSKYQNNKVLIAWEHCHPNGNLKYVKKVKKRVKNFDVFIPASNTLYEYYQEIITGPKCMYLPLCIDEIPTTKASLQTNQITVMGRLAKEKAYDDMLRTLKNIVDKNPKIKLNIVGAGSEKENLEKLTKELGLMANVIFHGNIVGVEKERVMLDTSVFVTTSHFESFGLVLLEAMSYGIPCVSFDSAKGSLEIIDHGKNGYIIKDRNIDEMANQILKLLSKTTKVMQSNAIKKAKEYQYKNVKKLWLEAFEVFSRGDIRTRIIFTSSAGGHYSELYELDELMNKYNSFLLTEDHDMMKEYKKHNRARSWYLRAGTKEHLIKFLFNFPFNIINSFKVYLKVKPDIIISTGAHTTVPICFIAKIFRKKVIFIETYANINTKTLSGKLVYPIADLFLVQWEEMLELYPKAKYKGGLK